MQVENLKCCDYKLDCDKKHNQEDELSPRLKNSIKDIVEKEGYTSYELDVKIIPADGGNYLASLIEICVNGTTNNGEKKMNFFIKHILPNDNFTMFSLTDVYYTEMFAYNELFKIYAQLQNEAKIPSEERFNSIKSYDKSSTEFIILENMAKKGYRTLNRLDTIPLRFAELSIQQLAKFHGLSFVLQKKYDDYFNKKIKSMKTGIIFNDEWRRFIKNFCTISSEYVNCDTKKKIEGVIPTILEKYPGYFNDEAPVMCLCHGDYRANNILLRTSEEEIVEVYPIDYQVIHYGCPINDILYLIYGATGRQFRKEHLEDIKNMYHDTLKKFLLYFDMEVEDYFPKKMFEDLWTKRIEYGLMTAVWFLPIVMASDEDLPDFSQSSPTDVVFKCDERIKPRLEEVVDEFVELGYL